jgi:DNA-binding CsgD family transcriptional regulator
LRSKKSAWLTSAEIVARWWGFGASGFSYEEAAQICGCAVGTIKSRVNRARVRLAAILSIESANDFGPDHDARTVGSATGPWRRW